MNDTPPHSALREWRALATNPVTLVFVACIAALLTIIGPFDTSVRLTLVPRFGYWLILIVLTYSVGFAANLIVRRAVAGRGHATRVLAVGLATGLGITPVVLLLNLATFGYWPAPADWPLMLGQFLGTALIITIMFEVIPSSGTASASANDARPDMPAVLDRLPLDKRGALLSLSSEDHYTRIRTTKGEEMVLLRLADAIREADPVAGLQVHRSHWVALAAVQAARRDGDRAILTLQGNTEIPVSRANVPAIREAGLLPR